MRGGFLSYVGNDIDGKSAGLVGLPLALAGQKAQIDLSQGVLDATYFAVGDHYWSPNGQRILFNSADTDYQTYVYLRWYWVDMSSGLPAPPARVENVPTLGDLDLVAWSPDSTAALIGGSNELYLVRFDGPKVTTQLVTQDYGGNATFCPDSSTIAYSQAGKTYITVPGGVAKPTVLAQALASSSPDDQWLLLSTDTQSLLAPCKAGATATKLAGPPTGYLDWSDDSKYVSISSGYDDGSILSVWDTSATNAAVFSVAIADNPVWWQANADRLLYEKWQKGKPNEWHVKDMPAAGADLNLPITGDLSLLPIWANATDRIEYTTMTGDAYLLQAAAGQKPRLILNDPDGTTNNIWFSPDLSKAIHLLPHDDGTQTTTQAFVLDLDENVPNTSLFTKPLTGDLSISSGTSGSDAPRIWRDVSTPDSLQELYLVPTSSFKGPPILLNRGTLVYDDKNQPRP